MSWLSKIFGGGASSDAAAEVIEYNGFRITPTPVNEGGQYRIGARIEREVDGEIKTHDLIRADMIRDFDECKDASIRKAKQMIDQMGDRLFSG
ncbi:HlyU family transcriptional regulator [uncultured Pelagimonas sp.]|uniref:HlyU family transcriptional regulator n=1 Tax=uncultured Pelagimonas sp. TaxID=1618102 RepID=UPI00263113D7|nr:HlyU family transcriptional regulator [uncultured Pelagimonas sp.]